MAGRKKPKLYKIKGGLMLSCLLNNQRINIFDEKYNKEQLKKWSNKNILICPACGNPYEYCHGRVISPYFRHKNKNHCEDKYSEPETEEHIQGKRDLYEWIKKQPGVTDVILEGWIPETKQRPDIMFKYNSEQCVIEYQCSPISTEYHERHELYQAANIKDVWICGAQKYFQCYHHGNGDKRINELEKESRVYYNINNKCIFTIDKNMDKNVFNLIIKRKESKLHFMKNIYDYIPNIQNYYLIKDEFKSYMSYSYYPSPTGRSSRKYPYPVIAYKFNKNLSLAKCMSLDSLKLKGIN